MNLLHNIDLCAFACFFFLHFFHSPNQDIRIEGGYEAVPTRDIHMKQIDYEEIWLDFLEHYVMPLQEEVFRGYASEVGYMELLDNCERGNKIALVGAQCTCRRGAISLTPLHLSSNFIISTLFHCLTIKQCLIQVLIEVRHTC